MIAARRLVLAGAIALGTVNTGPVAAQPTGGATHLVVVSGLGGDPELAARFVEWSAGIADAGEKSGLPDSNRAWLSEDPSVDPRIDGPSTREGIQASLTDLADRVSASDRVLLVLFGHGTEREGSPRLNLPGPDLTAEEWGILLDALDVRTVGFVNTASASGGFVPVLSAEGRVIITATRSGRERNLTRFGEHFARAWGDSGADTDKDGRVSLLEAYEFARLEVAREYESQDLLLSEHSLIDDDGDGTGAHEPDPLAGDGRLARTFFLTGTGRAPAVAGPATDDPELAALYAETARIEAAIADLRGARESLPVEEYESRLEELLVQLALTGRAIREAEGSPDE